jgi:hypothetical protein
MNDDIIESELIFKIHRLKKASGDWIPAIEDTKSHDVTPIWAAAMAYAILDRYLSSVGESNQHDFQEEMLHWLSLMIEDDAGSEFTDKMQKLDDMD